MSYLNHAHDPRRRATAIVTVGAVHALLAVGLLSGLAVEFTEGVKKRFEATDFPLPQPTPEPDPPPTTTPPVTQIPPAPLPPIPRDPPPGPIYEPLDETKLVVDPLPPYPPGPGPAPTLRPDPPAPGFTAKRAAPRNSGTWIDDRDYPPSGIRNELEGSVGYRLVVGTNGRVSSCELTRTSGHRVLDDATCRLLSNRARFDPATDETGAKVMGTYSGSVTWELPD